MNVKEQPFKDDLLSKIYEDNKNFIDFDKDFIDKKKYEILVYKAMQIAKFNLSKKDFGIFFKYYIQNWNQELISDFYGVTQPAIFKRLKKSVEVIKKDMKKWKFLIGGSTDEFFKKES